MCSMSYHITLCYKHVKTIICMCIYIYIYIYIHTRISYYMTSSGHRELRDMGFEHDICLSSGIWGLSMILDRVQGYGV